MTWFLTSDMGYLYTEAWHDSDPWKNREKLFEHSPINYAPNVKTPTLFIHSDEDERCWIAEGYQMFTALKHFDVKTKMVVFHGENHELSRTGTPVHRVRRIHEMDVWFDEYLK